MWVPGSAGFDRVVVFEGRVDVNESSLMIKLSGEFYVRVVFCTILAAAVVPPKGGEAQ